MSGESRIVLVAYQCGPAMGSVSNIGWQWFRHLAATRPVTLVTHVRNRAAIESAGALADGAAIEWIDTEWLAGPLYRLAQRIFPRSEHATFMLASLDWYLFDRVALKALRRRQAEGERHALVHIVTPVTIAATTVLHRLGLPVIRGPLNCGLGMPAGFDSHLRTERSGLARLRAISGWLDRFKGSNRNTHRFLVATRATRDQVPAHLRSRCLPMLENAIDLDQFPRVEPPTGANESLRVVFVGRLIAIKGVDMLLEAVARLRGRGRGIELTIVGDGPLRRQLQDQTRRLDLTASVTFRGHLQSREVRQAIIDADLLCLPSVRESGGGVLLEAMACSRPVVALDYGGPAELVDDEVGRLLPARNPAQVVTALADCLEDVSARPQPWRARGLAGRERVEREQSWHARVRAIESIYAACSASSTGAELRRDWPEVLSDAG